MIQRYLIGVGGSLSPDEEGDIILFTDYLNKTEEYLRVFAEALGREKAKCAALQAELKMERDRNKVCGMVVRENEYMTYRIKELEGALDLTAAIPNTNALCSIYRAVNAAKQALKGGKDET